MYNRWKNLRTSYRIDRNTFTSYIEALGIFSYVYLAVDSNLILKSQFLGRMWSPWEDSGAREFDSNPESLSFERLQLFLVACHETFAANHPRFLSFRRQRRFDGVDSSRKVDNDDSTENRDRPRQEWVHPVARQVSSINLRTTQF